jgi:DNA-binding SARP family transcriptional activator
VNGTRIGVLGPLLLTDSAGAPCRVGGVLRRTLLATLLVGHGREVPTDRLVHDLWLGDPPRTARNSLQVSVCQLRGRLRGAGVPATIETRSTGYLLRLDGCAFDAVRLESDARQAFAARSAGDLDTTVRLLEQALGWWRGPVLSDVRRTPALAAEARRLSELRNVVLEERIGIELRRGRDGVLVSELYSLVAEHPMHERLHEYLMIALHRLGRPADALQVYARIRQALRDKVGIEPSPALQALRSLVLTRAPARRAATLAVRDGHAVPLSAAGRAGS